VTRVISTLLVCALALGGMLPSRAGTLSTPTIVHRTTAAALSCLRWTPIGLCFWLRCGLGGCAVRSSVKVGHYNPELVVAAYNKLGGNPWTEIRSTLGAAQRAAATGLLGRALGYAIESGVNRTEGTAGAREHRNLVFREVDAMGHPVSILSWLSVTPLCRAQAEPFVPYYQSSIDALAWRSALPEVLYPASVTPGLREIGAWPLQSWGSVFPRTGWTTQAEEPKAAAITAQRVGDIVTRVGQPHLYLPLSGPRTTRQRVWPPGPLVENNPRTGTWQMLTPQAETSCNVFGTNDVGAVASWSSGRVDPSGEYVWNLWRPYKCCNARGQWFLFSLDWMAYPP
jgi:integrating conjugative element protein (TIGR03756 family)